MLKEYILINDVSLMGINKLDLIRILEALNYLVETATRNLVSFQWWGCLARLAWQRSS